jgi:hypothetical protein
MGIEPISRLFQLLLRVANELERFAPIGKEVEEIGLTFSPNVGRIVPQIDRAQIDEVRRMAVPGAGLLIHPDPSLEGDKRKQGCQEGVWQRNE